MKQAIVRRPEGFSGQHHCVLPPLVVARALKHPLLGGLLPTDAGLYPDAAGHFVDRPRGTTSTVILVCTRGGGWIHCRGRRSDVTPGVIAILPPNEAHAYGASDSEPWTLEWAHYAGEEPPAWRDAIFGPKSEDVVTQLPVVGLAEVNLTAVHEHLEAGYGSLQLIAAAAALRTSLAQIARLRRSTGAIPTVADSVNATATWMRANLHRSITLAALARRACLSPSHYSALFRQRFGFAPIDWLIRQRIQRACRLLDATSDKVQAIGTAVGFGDPNYFSRIFRSVMGYSPRAYREAVGRQYRTPRTIGPAH